jgi:hypothetical protein
MSRASGKNKEDEKKDASVSSGSEDDEETMEDGGREETPDVYRHSALGIYAGVGIFYLFFQPMTYYLVLGNGRKALFRRRRHGSRR